MSDEEEWHDISPSGRPKVISPVLQPRLGTPTEDPAKVEEIGKTDENQAVEQDETRLTPNTTQPAIADKQPLFPGREVQQLVASIEDASSEMTATASGLRPSEAPASSALNHKGVTTLSPVPPKRIWMSGNSPSN